MLALGEASAFQAAARELRQNLQAGERRLELVRGDAEEVILLAFQPVEMCDIREDGDGPGDRSRAVTQRRAARQDVEVRAGVEAPADEAQIAVRLAALCRQIAEEQRVATGRNIIVEMPQSPVEMEMDVDRVGQVLSNLLSNALKYSSFDEPVLLSADTVGDEVVFRVVDRGLGIPAEELPYIFERFYRVPGITVQTGSGVGLGLGLYICHEIVERHGGRIWAESTPGEGSAFYVALPLVPRRKPAGAAHNGHYRSAHAAERQP